MYAAPRLRSIAARVPAQSAGVEGQVVTVSAPIPGTIDRMFVAENQLVSKGDLLMSLDCRELERELEVAAAQLDELLSLGSPDLEPAGHWRRARASYLRARSRRLLADVRAPVSGRVIRTEARPGDPLDVSQPLVSILHSDDLWVMAGFGSDEFELVQTGQRASVHAGGRLFRARVESVSERDRSALLEFVGWTIRPSVLLRPGRPATVVVEVN